ncbi:hypothetical protein [Collimonas silvisoli]|uniref:hypothetical protein n=1 Tax=Collimonas silvisoli TaxID=2825884 RepID=UPI001B8B9C01|nr:hypothetical protein [Collimonas silvisoli]
MSSIFFTGPYEVNKEHKLDQTVLKRALDDMEAAGIRFSIDAIKDPMLRQQYATKIGQMSKEVMAEVSRGDLSPKEGALFANEMRNKILIETRKVTSPQALAFVQKLKTRGPTLEELMDKYSSDLFRGRKFRELDVAEKQKVYYTIIERSGVDRAAFTSGSRRLKIMGKVGIMVTALLAAHSILTADNKIKETARQGTILEGGVLGGYLAGLGVASLCGPAAPACAIAVVLIGAATGGILGQVLFDTYDEEVTEFQSWKIN